MNGTPGAKRSSERGRGTRPGREIPLAAEALHELSGRAETLAVAESLTGGLLAAALTGVPGASRVFVGSLTAYATEVKRDVLGVSGDLLARRGAVDPQVAREMAHGVRRLLGADWAVATTGVAGPAPQDGQPVGTVHLAVVGPGRVERAARLLLGGDRAGIRADSVAAALDLLVGELNHSARAQETEPG